MKWSYSLKQKALASVLLAVVFLFIILNNIYERRNISKLNDSFSSIYRDRLLAESYIYLFSDLLHNRAELNEKNASTAQIELIDEKLLLLIKDYDATVLTQQETSYFDSFKELILKDNKIVASINYSAAFALLERLSAIQIDEGTRLKKESNSMFLGSDISFKLEMAILIVIALIMQVIIFSSKSPIPINRKDIHLN
jgi:hypothetical protein